MTAWGAWIKLEAVESTQVLAHAGFDLIIVDLEHTLLDLSAVARHVAIGQALGLRVLVRIPDRTPALVQRLLDGGVDGLVVPHVDSAADASEIVRAARFAPSGSRGSGATSRAGSWGRRPRHDYLQEPATVIAQIESTDALTQIESIAATDGIEALMLGPADLALDAGATVAGADETVLAAARVAGIEAGSAGGVGGAGRAARLGLDFFVCAADTTLLAQAAGDTIEQVQSALPSSEQGAPT